MSTCPAAIGGLLPYPGAMAKYIVNQDAVAQARQLIEAKQYVLDSDWGDVQPKADARERYLEHTPGTTTPPGTSASPRAPTTRPRPATPSSTATFGACTAPG